MKYFIQPVLKNNFKTKLKIIYFNKSNIIIDIFVYELKITVHCYYFMK